MKYEGVCIAVKNIALAKQFYQELFGVEVLQKLKLRNDIRYLGEGVKEAEWGQRSIRFYDLDGHIIEVGENMKMVIKRFLDSGMSMKETSKRINRGYL